MTVRRAIVSKGDLSRMAAVVAAHNVVFEGRACPNGDLTFRLLPPNEKLEGSDDAFDDRLDKWAAS